MQIRLTCMFTDDFIELVEFKWIEIPDGSTDH